MTKLIIINIALNNSNNIKVWKFNFSINPLNYNNKY